MKKIIAIILLLALAGCSNKNIGGSLDVLPVEEAKIQTESVAIDPIIGQTIADRQEAYFSAYGKYETVPKITSSTTSYWVDELQYPDGKRAYEVHTVNGGKESILSGDAIEKSLEATK